MRRSVSVLAFVMVGLAVMAGCGTPGGHSASTTTTAAPPPPPQLVLDLGPLGLASPAKPHLTGTGFVPGHSYQIFQCAAQCSTRGAPITALVDGTLPSTIVLASYNFNSPPENCDAGLGCRFEAVSTTDSSDPTASLAISFAGH